MWGCARQGGVCKYRVRREAGGCRSPLGFTSPETGSGSIDPDELRTVLQSCLYESAISLPQEKLDQLTLALFESADKDCSGTITFEGETDAYHVQLLKAPEGYSFDAGYEMYTPREYGEWRLSIRKD